MTAATRRVLLGAATLGAVAAVLVVTRAPGSGTATLRAKEASVEPGAGGVQQIEIVVAGGEYLPNVIHGRAGAPLRLRVTSRERHGCATRLHIPDLHAVVELEAGRTVEALLPPSPRGSYLFTCDMKMVKGVFELE